MPIGRRRNRRYWHYSTSPSPHTHPFTHTLHLSPPRSLSLSDTLSHTPHLSSLVSLLRALRQVPFVRLDCVDAVTALFQDALDYMESHLDLGDSDEDSESEDHHSHQRLSSRAGPAQPPQRKEDKELPPPLRLGLGGGKDALPVLPPPALATKLIGSTVTRDYSSPSQSKRSLTGAGGKRGSLTLPSASLNLSGSNSSPSTTSLSPSSFTLPSSTPLPSSQSAVTSAATVSSSAPSSSSSSSSSLSSKLGLGLKVQGGSLSNTALSSTPPSTSPKDPSSPSPKEGGGQLGLAGPAAKGALGIGIAPSHKLSSRAQIPTPTPNLTDDEEKEGAGGSSGLSSGQSSDNDDEIIRVARPLAAKNKLLHRAAGLNASREFPSPKLGPRSLGTSPAGMGPRGVSAPNNEGKGQSMHGTIQRASVLTHAASVGSAISGGDLDLTLSAPPSLSSSNSSSEDVTLPEPTVLVDDDAFPALTEPGELGKDHQLSDKEALGLESDIAEEKDLVDEAMEKRPDPLAKLRNEVIVPITASPKQYRSSERLLTLAAASANADGTAIISDSEETSHWASHRVNPILSAAANSLSASAALPSFPSSSTTTVSPTQSASNTPKPAFLRRLDSPESHHGQLIVAKARLQMLINRAVQTIPNLKSHAMPTVHAKLQAALAKLETSTIQQ